MKESSSRNARKRRGIFQTSGEISTDEKTYKRYIGPSLEDLLDENFVSAVLVDTSNRYSLSLSLTYANQASSVFYCDKEIVLNRLWKKIDKYIDCTSVKNKLIYELNKLPMDFYEKLSKIPVVVIGKGIGKGLTNLVKLGASHLEVAYEKIDIDYVISEPKDKNIIEDLIHNISSKDEKILTFDSIIDCFHHIDERKINEKEMDNERTIIEIEKSFPFKWYKQSNKTNKNSLLEKTIPVRYIVKNITSLTEQMNDSFLTKSVIATVSSGENITNLNSNEQHSILAPFVG